ncbi:MAG: PEP-CTERM sorting domain-containing protein [Gammaproteobacteria bacterium]|nr:PEP-CTERM sorting domain-containing protein [Gammaproteobacteria bacterium]NNF60589.1 PEP-CTERM sorting domain-containing protein [Gammaproteobacteria bacterium]NNM21373.1 PEP-CTERM sorting domain-containing protein [Gammaproteobacteria bacterium]
MRIKETEKQQFEQDLLSYSISAQNQPTAKSSWKAYGAAASTALLASSALEAAIIYSGPQNINITASGSGATAYTAIDMDGGGADFGFGAANFGVYNTFYGSTVVTGTNAAFAVGYGGGGIAASATYGRASKFSSGATIGGGAGFAGTAFFNATAATSNTTAFNAGFNSSTGFIGVQLASGNFGWIQVHVDFSFAPGNNGVTILDWAYDDSGAAIRAGDTGAVAAPEPATNMLVGMGLLALGASGIRTLRRRKREAGLTS